MIEVVVVVVIITLWVGLYVCEYMILWSRINHIKKNWLKNQTEVLKIQDQDSLRRALRFNNFSPVVHCGWRFFVPAKTPNEYYAFEIDQFGQVQDKLRFVRDARSSIYNPLEIAKLKLSWCDPAGSWIYPMNPSLQHMPKWARQRIQSILNHDFILLKMSQ